jgi:nucleolar protein 15
MLQTGQSKHYGFIEFDSSSVAQIVADTMDNYLLMGHIMRCKVIPKDQVHPELWVGANRRWRPVPKVRVAKAEHNKVGGPSPLCNIARAHYISLQLRTQDEQMRVAHRLLKRQEERQRKLEKAGISYDLGAAGYVVSNYSLFLADTILTTFLRNLRRQSKFSVHCRCRLSILLCYRVVAC